MDLYLLFCLCNFFKSWLKIVIKVLLLDVVLSNFKISYLVNSKYPMEYYYQNVA